MVFEQFVMKKFLPYILATIIVIGVFGVFGAHQAEAEGLSGLLGFGDIAGLVLKKAFAWIGYFFLQLVSVILTIAGALLDTSIKYSIDNFANTSKAIVEQGWMISRDIANMFFIFILLYISIATILQLSGYGMKELLVTVVVVALLVNFSLVITRFIIDGSNILAMEFYTKATQIKIKGDTTGKFVSPSAAIMASFKPQSLFDSSVISVCEEYDAVDSTKCKKFSDTAGKGVFAESDATLINIGIMTIMGAIMLLVLAFVFFAGAVLFVIRTVMLWLLMIFSPLAFVAIALPATKSYASQWWKKLFDQAFFAPVYLFLLYLVINIISSKAILTGIEKDNETLSSAIMSPASNVNLILKFVIMIILMLASLVIAKQMGAVGASTMQSWGQSAKKWGQAKAGRISRRGAGWAAERAMDEKSKINQWTGGRMAAFSKLPVIGRGFAKVSSLREKENAKQKKEWEKQYGGYSEIGLAGMLKDQTLSDTKRKVIQGVLDKKSYGKEENDFYKKHSTEEASDKRAADIKEHEGRLAYIDVTLPTLQDPGEKQKLAIEKIGRQKEIKKLEKIEERVEKIKSQKFGVEGSYAERIKKLEESGGSAKPPSAPKT